MLLFEAKDSTIFKLFGKTIPALSSGDVVADNSVNGGAEEEHEIEQETVGEEPTETKKKDEVINLDTVSRLGEEPISPSTEKEDLTLKSSKKTEQEQEQGENSQDKTLKKPDKILPCPRCNSMDTKFCYYNNYNVNQPRHFCKKCQRYWTAGGVTRNVPVGAGRRKNKNFASQYRQITVPEEALLNSQPDLPNGVFHPSLNCNATLLAFGSDTPLCESMTSVLNLADRAMNNNSTTNGFNDSEELETPVTYVGGETVNDDSNKSSNTLTKPMEDETTVHGSEEQVIENCHPFPPHVPYFPGAPWSLPWNPALWSSPVPSSPPPFSPQGYTMPLYPAAACWGFTMPGAWSVPWLAQPLPNSTVSNSGPNSPTLGKHSREENMLKSNEAAVEDERSKGNSKEKCLWVPKTLRIEDLGEAAKSSIWRTLGIKNNKAELFPGGGLFKTFPSQGGETNCVIQNSSVLQANPAALSRSINFHETS